MIIDIILFVLAAILSIPVIGAYFAQSRGRSFWKWYFICLFLPVISFIILLILPDEENAFEKELRQMRIDYGMMGTTSDIPPHKLKVRRIVQKNPVSQINFALRTVGVQQNQYIEVFLNGESLIERLRKFEEPLARKSKVPMLAGNYEGLPTHVAVPPARHWLGEPHLFYRDREGRTVIAVCAASGSVENWAWSARIGVFRKHVVWYDFRNLQKAHEWSYKKFPPIVFARPEYEAALLQLAELCPKRG